MILHTPFEISSRLMPSLKIGDGVVGIAFSKRPGKDGRTRYTLTIDAPNVEFSCDDLQSGCGGGNLVEGMRSALSFLAACGSAINYNCRTRSEAENSDLFPSNVAEWCAKWEDEITMMKMMIEESESELIEEIK